MRFNIGRVSRGRTFDNGERDISRAYVLLILPPPRAIRVSPYRAPVHPRSYFLSS